MSRTLGTLPANPRSPTTPTLRAVQHPSQARGSAPLLVNLAWLTSYVCAGMLQAVCVGLRLLLTLPSGACSGFTPVRERNQASQVLDGNVDVRMDEMESVYARARPHAHAHARAQKTGGARLRKQWSEAEYKHNEQRVWGHLKLASL